MLTRQRHHLFLSAILLCGLLITVGVLTTVPPNGQAVSAYGTTTFSSRLFLPLIMKGATTYSALLSTTPSVLQIMGTGGLLGFGMILGLVLLIEKPK